MNKLTLTRDDLLTCTQAGCGRQQRAKKMGNRKVPITPMMCDQELLRAVICSECRKAQLQQGHDVPRLADTVRTILALQNEREDQAKRSAHIAIDVRNYANGLLNAPVYSTGGTFVMPTSKPAKSGFACGLPLNCCDHSQECGRFLVIGGEVIGLCHMASDAFIAFNRTRGNVGPTDRLFVWFQESKARRHADNMSSERSATRKPAGTHKHGRGTGRGPLHALIEKAGGK
jgi:hypothetical protein